MNLYVGLSESRNADVKELQENVKELKRVKESKRGRSPRA